MWTRLNRRCNTADPATRQALREQLPAAARDIWKALEPILDAYETQQLKDDPAEVIFQFMKAGYDQMLLDTYEDYERRRDDLQEMMAFMSGFESAEAFLNEVALVTNVDAEPDLRTEQAGECLRLSTVHQAKGLEWKAVMILWAADGMFPSARSLNEPDGEDEERRLFYVAVTRAKDDLIFCLPEVRRMPDGGVTFCSPSRFVQEIPPDRLRQEQVGFL